MHSRAQLPLVPGLAMESARKILLAQRLLHLSSRPKAVRALIAFVNLTPVVHVATLKGPRDYFLFCVLSTEFGHRDQGSYFSCYATGE